MHTKGLTGDLPLQAPQAVLNRPADTPERPPALKRNNVQRVSAKKNQQSCTLCRRRKVKCDRGIPCGSCTRAGTDCVPSIPSRAPRGRQGGRKRKIDGELLERIAKLEALIEDVGGTTNLQGTTRVDNGPMVDMIEGPSRASIEEVKSHSHNKKTKYADNSPIVGVTEESSRTSIDNVEGHSHDNGTNHVDNSPSINVTQRALRTIVSDSDGSRLSQNAVPGFDRYMGASFWATLSEEINGLKDVLGDFSDEEDGAEEAHTPASSLSNSERNDSEFIISRAISVERTGNPNPHQLYTFCEIYLKNVDPVFKILHAPSLRRYLQEGATELECSPGPRGLEALKLAISYAATVSMTDGECRHRTGEDRVALMAKYREGTE